MEPSSTIDHAIILAAGRGKRLGPLTENCPKPLIPVQGKPVLLHILDGLKSAGIQRVTLVVGYLGQMIEDLLGDGSSLGLQVNYVQQPVPNGTGAAILLAKGSAGPSPFLTCYGDLLTSPIHYRQVVDRYVQGGACAVIGMNPVDDPWQGGAVYLENGMVTRVIEKPPKGTSNTQWNLAGINVFGPELWSVLEAVLPSSRGEVELTSAIHDLLGKGKKLAAVKMEGFWSDIGTPEALAEAELTWREE